MNEKKYHIGKLICKILNRSLDVISIISILILVLFCAYSLYDTITTNEEASNKKYEPYRPTVDDSKSFEDFLAVNPDVCGWLTIPGTGVDYPLVQGENNSYYLSHNALKEVTMTGSLYLDYIADKDFSDFSTVIYGHHMERDKMFGDLDKFLDEEFFNEHTTASVYFYSNNEWKWHDCDVTAVIQCDVNDELMETVKTYNESYEELLDVDAVYKRDFDSNYKYIACSTCQNQLTNGRTIVLLKIHDN